MINVWHGKVDGILHPKLYIKKTVEAYNLKRDSQVSRKKACGFVDVYLENTFFNENSYEIVKPFKEKNFFCSPSSRSIIIKVLLYPKDLSFYFDF